MTNPKKNHWERKYFCPSVDKKQYCEFHAFTDFFSGALKCKHRKGEDHQNQYNKARSIEYF